MKRIARALIRLYPRLWRARYAVEFLAVLDDTQLTWLDLTDIIAAAFRIRFGEKIMDAPTPSPRILHIEDRDIPHGFEIESAIEFTREDGRKSTVRYFYREIDFGDSYIMLNHSSRDGAPAQTILVSGVKGEVSGDFRSDRTEMLVLHPDGAVQRTEQTVNTWLKQQTYREKIRAKYREGRAAGLTVDQIFQRQMRLAENLE